MTSFIRIPLKKQLNYFLVYYIIENSQQTCICMRLLHISWFHNQSYGP